jgi:hypothetical protein
MTSMSTRPAAADRVRRGAWLRLAFLLLPLAGCVQLPPGVEREFVCDRDLPNRSDSGESCGTWQVDKPGSGYEYLGLPVHDGMVVLIERPDPASLFLSLAAQRPAPFVHAGLIVVERKGPMVYESFGTFTPWHRGPPTRHMGGGVRKVTLRSFLQRPGIIEAYAPLSGTDVEAVVRFAQQHLAQHTAFDGRFDADDDSAFYCVEFVSRALEAGGAPALPRVPLNDNASMRVVLDWLEVHPSGLLLAGDLAEPERRMWRVSRIYRPEQIDRYFALQRELHARFTPEQKLGALFAWRSSRLQWRPQVRAYLEAGLRSGSDPPAWLARPLLEGAEPGQ